VVRRFANSSNPESNAGRSVSSGNQKELKRSKNQKNLGTENVNVELIIYEYAPK
jgi:hypothetical protein